MSETSQVIAARWLKSSYSAANNECVEVAQSPTKVGIRDSKACGRQGLAVSAYAFTAFVDGLKNDGTHSHSLHGRTTTDRH